jgi:hypothetical protein
MKFRVFTTVILAGQLMSSPLYAATSLSVEDDAIAWTTQAASLQLLTDLITPSVTFIAQHYGPFTVVAIDKAELNGDIDTETLSQFKAMLRDFPGIKQIDMIECAGTDDDEANLSIARLIRSNGITTFVPSGGSVRSGGVELFLAGAIRKAAPDAEFGVHSWRDEGGFEADDYSDEDPVNQQYVQFYRAMGMDSDRAKAFYDLTNSVSNDDALYLGTKDIAQYIALN